MAAIKHFLLVFDHHKERLISERNFEEDSARALAAYSDCERRYKDDPAIEIVLIGSDSIRTVRSTHANYYNGTAAVSKYLVGL